jgi:hypothetical protein
MQANTTGSHNVAVGRCSLKANTTANSNVAIGTESLDVNTTGADNTAVGTNALGANTTAGNNTAVGSGAMASNTTAAGNTGIGNSAGSDVTTGIENVFVGLGAGGGTITTGCRNVFIGTEAGRNGTATSNKIAIGMQSYPNNTITTPEIVMGFQIEGKGANNFTFGKTSNRVYNVFTSNASWTRDSDLRLKTNIKNSNLGLDFINNLRPVTYNWKASQDVDPSLKNNYDADTNHMDTEVKMNGLIAQEVKQALIDSGVSETDVKDYGVWHADNEGVQAISREMFVIPLINAIKELKARIEVLENE